ncbi:protein-glutamate methylesterase/protein-glutamine glutaminase [Dendrosporobacter sp. 1207_IL3150]|uniref:protein-glutamate methylesterase/protein-glutamine glutaminase n=1 Tax=Dendrosporobacter sp. 1207_IL3150 TaxID=3084054 RepID=UPI002FD8B9F5
MKPVRVLIVDDSMLFREVLSRILSSDDGIEVVATASDPFDARDKILKYRPDVMTLDIEMPRMNGIEFLRRLIPQYPMPVIVVSTLSEAVLDALQAGAVDFITKPNIQSPSSVESFMQEFTAKVKTASLAKVKQSKLEIKKETVPESKSNLKLIAIGASTGGTEAIFNILKALPTNLPGIVIVQHIPPVFSKMFADRLNNSTAFSVSEAKTGDIIERGKVLLAPGDKHMKVVKVGGILRVECFDGSTVNGHCPSVDVLFDSISREVGRESVGVILTGMGYDGAKGLLAMRKQGAQTIGQDEASSVVYGMPKSAFNIGAVARQAPLSKIPELICSLTRPTQE